MLGIEDPVPLEEPPASVGRSTAPASPSPSTDPGAVPTSAFVKVKYGGFPGRVYVRI
jgi:hypothetical protein